MCGGSDPGLGRRSLSLGSAEDVQLAVSASQGSLARWPHLVSITPEHHVNTRIVSRARRPDGDGPDCSASALRGAPGAAPQPRGNALPGADSLLPSVRPGRNASVCCARLCQRLGSGQTQPVPSVPAEGLRQRAGRVQLRSSRERNAFASRWAASIHPSIHLHVHLSVCLLIRSRTHPTHVLVRPIDPPTHWHRESGNKQVRPEPTLVPHPERVTRISCTATHWPGRPLPGGLRRVEWELPPDWEARKASTRQRPWSGAVGGLAAVPALTLPLGSGRWVLFSLRPVV